MSDEETKEQPRKPSGAQRRKAWIDDARVFKGGVWWLVVSSQPPFRTLRGKPR